MDHPDLLSIDLINVLRMLRMCPKIGQTSVTEVVKEHPSLLLIPSEKVYKWCNFFEKLKGNWKLLLSLVFYVNKMKGRNGYISERPKSSLFVMKI